MLHLWQQLNIVHIRIQQHYLFVLPLIQQSWKSTLQNFVAAQFYHVLINARIDQRKTQIQEILLAHAVFMCKYQIDVVNIVCNLMLKQFQMQFLIELLAFQHKFRLKNLSVKVLASKT